MVLLLRGLRDVLVDSGKLDAESLLWLRQSLEAEVEAREAKKRRRGRSGGDDEEAEGLEQGRKRGGGKEKKAA